MRDFLIAGLSAGASGAPRWPRLIATSLIVVAILASVLVASLDTLPDLNLGWRSVFDFAAMGIAFFFALEYVARIALAPILAAQRPRARVRYLLSFLGFVDLVAIVPIITPALALGAGLRDETMLFAMAALFKLARYVTALPLIVAVMRQEARSLLAALLSLLVVLVFASAIMYFLERHAQPQVFASIPHALWWGIVTMGTVGYGDVVPMTGWGRLFGGIVILVGVALFAVPAGILATGFASEIRKRDFIVTWQAVARVPLFADLDASRIAAIARLLKPQFVPGQQAIIRRGEPADAMFFIMEGEVEVDIKPNPVHLGPGQFFGEIALITEGRRSATVTAIEETRLLALDVVDFKRLMKEHPDLEAAIRRVAEERLQQRG